MYYFGTDGIRDKADVLFEKNIPYLLGRAISSRGGKVVVARDVRISSLDIEKQLCKGLLDGASHIYLCGVLPTPALAYIAQCEKADYAIMITASHNPPEYNGLKVFGKNGEKLERDKEIELDDLLHAMSSSDDGEFCFVDELSCADVDVVDEQNDLLHISQSQNHRIKIVSGALFCYTSHVKKLFPRFDGIKVCLDLACGCFAGVAKDVFSSLGCVVRTINDVQDGYNVNVNCGATNMNRLLDECKNDEIGFSFDGDGDRVLAVVDGKVYDGDGMLLALSTLYRIQGKLRGKFVVGTILTNQRLQRELAYHNTALVRADVGDKNVLDEMKKHGSILGGEQSGHIIMLDKSSTGDGLLTALSLLEVKKVIGSLPKYTPYPTLSLNIPLDRVDTTTLDKKLADVQKLTKNSRLIARPSGTEPLLRITYECQDKNADKIFDKVKKIFEISTC